jgi:lysophospholipase L1-like esterase
VIFILFTGANDMTKKILCYGDSNTWGQVAYRHVRLPREEQWPQILQSLLGDDWLIDQQGLSGRTAGNFETDDTLRKGQDPYPYILASSMPVTHIVFALGANDLQRRYNRTTRQIAADLKWYADTTEEIVAEFSGYDIPRLYFAVPPVFTPSAEYFDADLARYHELADFMHQQLPVIDIGQVDLSEDGIHISPQGHQQFAHKVYETITRNSEESL